MSVRAQLNRSLGITFARATGVSSKAILALASGLALGIAVSLSGNAALAAIPRFLEPIGTMWVNALRMTVIPLVVSAILIGITSMPDPRHVGRIGGRALLTFVVVLSVASSFATAVGPFVLARLHIDPSAASTLLSTATSASDLVMAGPKTIGVGQWVSDLLPANPVKAAADGAMLQLIVFALLVGVAVGRIEESRRQPLMRVVRVVYEAALTLVGWVLAAAPVGVFALAASLATKLGIAAAGAVAFYVGAVSAMTLCFALLFYPAAWLVGKRTLPEFARACAPAQAVAFSSRSSLVSLPALLQGAHDVLRLPLSIRSFVLPLAVAMFRPAGAIAIPMGVLFVARLYGVELTPPQLVAVALAAVLTTFSAPGIPGGSILVMVPVLLSAGLPAEAVGLLIGVDAIPDMVRTVTNVTGDMAVAAILARFEAGTT